MDILLAMDVEKERIVERLEATAFKIGKIKKSPAKGAWIDVGSNTAGTEMLLAQIDVVIGICESALRASAREALEDDIRDAKKWYAEALRCAGRLSFSVSDIESFEIRTVKLEEIISKLERRFFFERSEPPHGKR